jgi:hypothetical protein
MKRYQQFVMTSAVAIVCATALAAQAPAGQQKPAQEGTQKPAQEQNRAAADQDQSMTLVGCLYRERDIPGVEPNVAERAGIGEDYILADARPAAAASGASQGTGGAVSAGANAGRLYKVEQIDDEKLQALVGKRVEVTGRVEGPDTPTGTAGAANRDPDEYVEIEASMIRETSGNCPATPAAGPAQQQQQQQQRPQQ